jgi:regulatory protein
MFKKKEELLTKKELRHLAIGLLARREYSAHELTNKFLPRAENPLDWDEVLQRLQADKYQDDTRFCESFIRSSLYKPHGPIRIKQSLHLKGIDSWLIEVSLEQASPDWMALAIDARTRRYGEQLPTDAKEKARQQRFLQSRGFTLDVVYGAFKSQ